MRALLGTLVLAAALAGCSQTESAPEPVDSATVSTAPAPTAASTPPRAPTTAVPTSAAPVSESPAASSGDDAFCAYLKKSSKAAQQVEDPAAFVALVEGAQAVAPGAIEEDLALYAESVRKLAILVTGSPKQAAKADVWLAENEDVVASAQANVDNYSQSVCGMPFITGEGE
ncbi:MAG: hypothetical protein MUF33_03900 [Candidatus Nanopelagicales bacterium]|jgi:hypothetical protein|nr:hypothetical protein [Candidatus Nanopelagicales bacterium]